MDYFDRVARDWDTLRASYFDERVREAAIERARLDPQMTVADVGTGTGFMIVGLAPLVKRVYGFDGSGEMLKVAAQNLEAFQNVELHQADGLALPLPSETVNAVFANMYLHHIDEPRLAISEMFRILGPGGRLVLTDMDEHDQAWMREEMGDVWLGLRRDEVKKWLVEAGLSEVEVDCAPTSCCTDSPCGEKVAISIFVASGVR